MTTQRERRAFARWRPVVLSSAVALISSCGGGGSADNTPAPTAPAVLSTVNVTLSSATLQVGQTTTASASGLDQNGAPYNVGAVTWASSSPAVATVSGAGQVSALTVGTTQILGTSGAKSGQATLTVVPIPVATVAVAPSATFIVVGSTQQLTATTLDAGGATLTGRVVSWSTSDATKASVNASGLVTGIAVGNATITATSEGKSGAASVSVGTTATSPIVTAIHNPDTFVSGCPTNDPAFNTIRADFAFLSAGVPSSVAITCTEPYTSTPVVTEELLHLQAFRVAYYMNSGTAGKLPWTPLGLYDWMKSQVAGVNFNTNTGGSSYCCESIAGKRYIGISRRDAATLLHYRSWPFLSGWMALLAHEARHAAGPGQGPGHVTGCPAFPLPSDPLGCDATYDLTNLGSYGVQYWLFSNWASGRLNVGIGCLSPASAENYATDAARTANLYPPHFVSNAPPNVVASVPYGGPCYP